MLDAVADHLEGGAQATLAQPIFRIDRWFQLKAAESINEQAALQLSATEQNLILPRERLELALTRITAPQREALEKAAQRVRSYHEKQKQDSWAHGQPSTTATRM